MAMLLAVALIAAAACQSAPTDSATLPLNSERIRAEYGSYGVTVIAQDNGLRYSCLYSDAAGGRVCRTLAIVAYANPQPDGLQEPMRAVQAGASLGATLAAAGWEVTKVNRYLGHFDLQPTASPVLAGWLSVDQPVRLGLHVYELRAVHADRDLAVADVLELHHPDYLSAAELADIYRDLPRRRLSGDALDRWRQRLLGLPPREAF